MSVARDRAIDRLGMMLFLGSETMLFGALLGAAFALILVHPGAVAAGSARLDLWLGGLNTAILLTSSLLVAIAVEVRQRRARTSLLGGAALLGLLFLGVKALEYSREFAEGLMPGTANAHFDSPAHQLFMNLYFIATGLHAIHVGIGIALLAALAWRVGRGRMPGEAVIGNVGLYWHLVDAIWVVLYPVLYLTRG